MVGTCIHIQAYTHATIVPLGSREVSDPERPGETQGLLDNARIEH
jgi:hypothetical protein